MEEGPGVGSRAIIRPQAPAAFTRPIMKSAQWSAMPRPAAASAAERASEATTTSRSEEHTSELQSLMRISYAVFCLKKKNKSQTDTQPQSNDTKSDIPCTQT